MVGYFYPPSLKLLSPAQNLSEVLKKKGWNVYIVSNVKNPFLKTFDKVYKIFKLKNKYDAAIIDLFSGKSIVANYLICLLLKLLKKKIIINLQGGNLPETRGFNKIFLYKILKISKKNIAPSYFLAERLKGFTDKKIEVIPNGIKLENYKAKLREFAKPKLLWLRTFLKLYNPMLIPKVLNLLKEKYPDISINVAGLDKKDGSLEETFKLADSLQVKERINYIGGIPKSEVPLFLETGDIFINTTNIDNVPVTVIEALASGLCIVSTNVGGIPYILENEKDCLLVPPNDEFKMAKAISRLIEDKELAKKISLNSIEKAKNFSWEKIIPIWEKAIE